MTFGKYNIRHYIFVDCKIDGKQYLYISESIRCIPAHK